MRRILLPGLLLLLCSCAHAPATDAQVPTFAKMPYEPFARSAAIAIAEREWRLFGSPVDDGPSDLNEQPDKPERVQGLWQRVGEYWWLGLPNGVPEQRWTGKHDASGQVFAPEVDERYAWSAAFISYVMRIAGAGTRFPYTASHSDYINIAADASARRRYAIVAEDPASYAPQPGDLICLGRHGAKTRRFSDLPDDGFPSHCDIVVDRLSDVLTVIGGNVQDAVTLKHVPISASGQIADTDGTPFDTRYAWFVVVRVLYDRD